MKRSWCWRLIVLWTMISTSRGQQSDPDLFSIQPLPVKGICGNCLFMNQTTGVSCLSVYQRAWNPENDGEFYTFIPVHVCLGLKQAAPNLPATADKEKRFPTYMGYNQPVQGIGETWVLEFTPKMTFVSMFSTMTVASVLYNQSSAWAVVDDLIQRATLSEGETYAVSNVANNSVPWFKTPFEDPSIRKSTLVFIEAPGGQHFRFATSYCKNSWAWPRCMVDGWDQWILEGSVYCNRQTTAQTHWCGEYRGDHSPVTAKAIWCTELGTISVAADQVACGPTRCSISGGISGGQQGICRANGYCFCKPGWGGADCSQRIPEKLRTGDVTKFWPPPSFASSPSDFFNGKVDIYTNKDIPAWKANWKCSDFDPCSGGGRCVDPVREFDAPTCECFDGFFGNSTWDRQSYATALFCGEGAFTDAETKRGYMTWSDETSASNAYPNIGLVTAYMMFHQCLLWRGPDNPPNWQVATAPPKATENEKLLVKRTAYHPTAPRNCTNANYLPAGGCTPCPPCNLKNSKCVSQGGCNICQCDDGYTGLLCNEKKCPDFEDSPCGIAKKRGQCRLQKTGKWACECENGYTGLECSTRVIGCEIGLNNQICSGSALSSFPDATWLPAHGFCNASFNATHGRCFCLEGFSGVACEMLACPKAPNGLECNSIMRPSPVQGQPPTENVCNRKTGICECNLAWLDADGAFPNQQYQNRFWGASCQFSWNDSCRDPATFVGSSDRVWCNSNDYRLCQSSKRNPNGEPPFCNCTGTPQTGPFCRYSICGRYNTNEGSNRPLDVVCDGFGLGAQEPSGTCFPLNMASVFTPRQNTLQDASFEKGGGGNQGMGRCGCRLSSQEQIQAITGGLIKRATAFQGQWCQQAVPGCTNPDPEKLQKQREAQASGAPIFPCSSTRDELHGACVQIENAPDMPGVPSDDKFRCVCTVGWQGTYCETQKAVCEPQCRPGAGECTFTSTLNPPVNDPYKNKCFCYGPGTIWSSKAGVGPTPGVLDNLGRPYGPFGCDMDWCNMTQGITSLYKAACFCPDGRSWTQIDIAQSIGNSILPEPRYPNDMTAFYGCRRTCPIAPPTAIDVALVTLDRNGLECGMAVATSSKGTPPPGPGANGFSVCTTARNVHQIQDYDRKPACECGAQDGLDPWRLRRDPRTGNLIPPLETDPTMKFVLNPEKGYCEPVCGNGAKYLGSFNKTSGIPNCQCREKDEQRWDIKDDTLRNAGYRGCCAFLPPTYTAPRCLNGGTYDCQAKTCRCLQRYQQPNCEKTDCYPGEFSPQLGDKFCNCSSPWRTDLRLGSPTYGACVSMCLKGYADPSLKRCVCEAGWTGDLCEISKCAPWGYNIAGGKCQCTTIYKQGDFCQKTTCNADFSSFYQDPLTGLPSCKCSTPLWAGELCDKSACGILGDEGALTGTPQVFQNPSSGMRETICVCKPGYTKDANGICSIGRCGSRGSVVAVGEDDYICKCFGPDTQTSPKGECIPGVCEHGSLQFNVNGQKVVCFCDLGWSGPSCSQFACQNTEKWFFSQGQCFCLFPWTGATCEENVCGKGAKSIDKINLPGNPVRWTCQCNRDEGYIAVLQTFPVSSSQPFVCAKDCDGENTEYKTWDTCTCKDGFTGPTCRDGIPGHCPRQLSIEEQGGFSASKFNTVVILMSVFWVISLLAMGLGMYFGYAKQKIVERGTTSGHRPLFSKSS
jgi:hypothetical protein